MSNTPLLSESTPLVSSKRSKIRQRLSYYVPITSWLPSYSLKNQLKGDLLAGLTIACLLVPQSISYATSLAHLSPLAGLFSASIPALFYAIFGSSRHLNVAPEAALSLLIGQTIRELVNTDLSEMEQLKEAVAITTVITFQEGLFAFLLGFFRLGFIDVVLSRALLRGFITAIALVIAIEQLIPMFGLAALEQTLPTGPPSTTIEKTHFLFSNLDQAHGPTSIVAFSSLAALVLIRVLKVLIKSYYPGPAVGMEEMNPHPSSAVQTPGISEGNGTNGTPLPTTSRPGTTATTKPTPITFKLLLALPEILLVILLTTFLSSVLSFSSPSSPWHIPVLGRITVSTHRDQLFSFPITKGNWKWVKKTTGTSVMIALIGYLDSVVAAKQNSDRFGYSVSSNREWVALGISNMGGACIPGTLPAYGSITRSRLNADTGSSSQMSSLITSTLILLATFFLLPALAPLPKCVLSAVVFLVVISLLIELPHDVKYYWKMRAHNDLALMALTFALTIAYNIEVGVLVSFVISLLVVVRRSSKVRISILGRIPGTNKWSPISEDPEAEELPSWTGVLVIAIRESLDFANTAQLKERLRRLELFGHEPHHPSERPRRSQAKTLGFDMGDVESIDAAAVQIFLELLESYKARNVTLFLTRARLHPSVATSLSRSGIIANVVGLNRVFDSLEEADRVLDLSLSAGGSMSTSHVAGGRGASGITPGSYFPGIGGHGHDPAEALSMQTSNNTTRWETPDAWLGGIRRDSDYGGHGGGTLILSSHDDFYTAEESNASPQPGGQPARTDDLDVSSHRYYSSHGGHDY